MAAGALGRLFFLSGKTDASQLTAQDLDAFEEVVRKQAIKDATPRVPKPGHRILTVTCADCGTAVIEFPEPYWVTCPNRTEPGGGTCGAARAD